MLFGSFTVRRPFQGLIASLDVDRMAQDAGDGADPAGAGGDSPSPSDGAHFDDGEGADGGDAGNGDPARSAAADADDEDFDEEDDPDKPLTAEDQIKKLRGALKKAKRKLGSTRGERQALKELRDRGVNLNDLYADSREFRRLQQQVASNPRLKALLSGGSDEEPPARSTRTADRRAEPETDFTFDDSPEALGFDPKESRANERLADGLKRVAKLEHRLERELTRLNPDRLIETVNRLDTEFTRRDATAIRHEWGTAMDAAAKHITNEGQRDAFLDLMRFAMRAEAGKRPAKFFVDHYLKKLGVNPAQAGRARAAADQQRNRVASHVAGLPRQSGGNGTPAPARKAKELLADVHKRIRHLNAS